MSYTLAHFPTISIHAEYNKRTHIINYRCCKLNMRSSIDVDWGQKLMEKRYMQEVSYGRIMQEINLTGNLTYT